jgi:hypothetical protein
MSLMTESFTSCKSCIYQEFRPFRGSCTKKVNWIEGQKQILNLGFWKLNMRKSSRDVCRPHGRGKTDTLCFLCGDGSMDFIHRPKSKILKIKITTFRKLALLPSSGEWRGRREEDLLGWPVRQSWPPSPTVHFCVPCFFYNKPRLFPSTALTDFSFGW